MSEGKTPPPKSGDDRLDAVLAAWPAADRTALEWDDSAERVLTLATSGESTRLGRALSRVSDEDLLRPPLPTSPAEVQSSAPTETRSEGTGMTTASRERDRAGFRDLAKLANMTPPPSAPASSAGPSSTRERVSSAGETPEREENSGVINLAALAASEEGKAAPAGNAPTSVSAAAPGMSTMRSAVSEPLPAAPAPARAGARDEKRKGGPPWTAISTVVAAAAVAAGVFFGLQRGAQAPPAIAAAPAVPATTVVATQPAATATSAKPSAAQPDDRGVDPSSLPPVSTGAVAARPSVPGGPTPKPATAPASPTQDPALVAVIPAATAPATGSSTASLQTLMQQAAGVTSGPTATAAATSDPDAPLPAPGSVPLKPSQGAIQGALGAALPAARGCLGPDDPISHATITFKSDGSVQSVSISGGAAGKPAEACIRSALGKARVTPFAQPTFTAPATIRPN